MRAFKRNSSLYFAPNKFGGLELWLDASQLTGLVNNDPLGTWTDFSGKGNHATQGTAGFKPIYKTNIVNEKPIIRFDGIDDLMTCALTGSEKAVTFFAVVYVMDTTDISNAIVGTNANGGLGFKISNTGKIELVKVGTILIGASTTSLGARVFKIVAGTYSSSGAFAFYLNGAADGSGTNDQTLTAGLTTQIGRDAVQTPFEGDIAEILKFHRVLTSVEIAYINSYLMNKYIPS